MARFVKLTRLKGDGEFVLNVDTIEYMLPIPNNAGTTLYTVTHHTKYEVRESMDDILSMLDDVGMVLTVAKNTYPTMETDSDMSV
jgi:uncharacterized protein YlzI (FlbEa/FlbD family)